jgi:hypothetical protein
VIYSLCYTKLQIITKKKENRTNESLLETQPMKPCSHSRDFLMFFQGLCVTLIIKTARLPRCESPYTYMYVAVYISEFKTYIAFKSNMKLKCACVYLLYYAEELLGNITLRFNMDTRKAHTWAGSWMVENTLFFTIYFHILISYFRTFSVFKWSLSNRLSPPKVL